MNLADTSYSTSNTKLLFHSTVVCVTNQRQCERLIQAGRLIADLSKTELAVISVVSPNGIHPDTSALDYLFGISKQNNAIMSIQYSDDPFRCIAEFIKQHEVVNVITGMRDGEHSILPKLWRRCSSAKFFSVNLDGQVTEAETTSKPNSLASSAEDCQQAAVDRQNHARSGAYGV